MSGENVLVSCTTASIRELDSYVTVTAELPATAFEVMSCLQSALPSVSLRTPQLKNFADRSR